MELNTIIKKCRLCEGIKFKEVINLGIQAFTGFFPYSPEEKIKKGPLVLVQCQSCKLLQLKHLYKPHELFGNHYGYRSGLNASMVKHLKNIVEDIEKTIKIKDNDLLLDIGSNDGTLLSHYKKGLKMGYEPITKFHKYYSSDIRVWPYFFPMATPLPCKVITSIAMFYDINKPLEFMKSIRDSLTSDGIWVTEQSYAPAMIKNCSYDTICHEHACYYDLPQMKLLAKMSNLKIIGVNYNETNGGSFRVTLKRV